MILNTLWYNNTAATYRDENGKLVCEKIMHMQSLIMKSFTESAVAQFSALPRGEEKRPMVLASSREDGAPKASHSYIIETKQ